MTRALALTALICAAFGLGARQVLGTESTFSEINIGVALLAAGAALLLALRDVGPRQQPALRAPAVRALRGAVLCTVVAVAAYGMASRSTARFDWTFEGRFELADASLALLAELPAPLELLLYYDAGDPRIRNTRLLLEQFVAHGNATLDVRELALYPKDEDRYGIGSSNSVVLRLNGRWDLVQRPTEGALYQALSSLVRSRNHVVYVSVGAGEGDLERTDDLGYSGLRAALESEGIELRPLPLAVLDRIPHDADAVLVIRPERRLRPEGLETLRAFIANGGNLIALLEPNPAVDSGIEALLAQFGIGGEAHLVIDPASGPIDGDPAGLNPIAFNYHDHPITRGLDRNRMTFFRSARTFTLRKRMREDKLRAVVSTSADAWQIAPEAAALLEDAYPEAPEGTRFDYLPLVVTAEVERGNGEARIVALGDADLAANRQLRALYNQDLVLNAIHWAVEDTPLITLRPKSGGRQLIQFPVPIQQSLSALYGIGLLIPQLLLLAGALVWLRNRSD